MNRYRKNIYSRIKKADTDRFILWDESASSGKFAVFVGDFGNTFFLSEAMKFRREEAYKFKKNWESTNEGNLYIIPAGENIPTVEVVLNSTVSEISRFFE